MAALAVAQIRMVKDASKTTTVTLALDYMPAIADMYAQCVKGIKSDVWAIDMVTVVVATTDKYGVAKLTSYSMRETNGDLITFNRNEHANVVKS